MNKIKRNGKCIGKMEFVECLLHNNNGDRKLTYTHTYESYIPMTF